MSQTLESAPGAKAQEPRPRVVRIPKSTAKRNTHRMMQWIRRGHLYFGLFLFPFVILYGITAFLFNHPSAFPDAPVHSFSRSDLAGTAFEELPDLRIHAQSVIAALNEKLSPDTPYELYEGEIRLAGRETMIAMVKAEGKSFSISFDPLTCSGTVRTMTSESPKQKAPFAVGEASTGGGRGMSGGRGMRGSGGSGGMGPMRKQPDGLDVPNNLAELLQESVPALMKRLGLPVGEVMLSQSPELKFIVNHNDKLWTASYNPITTVVSGVEGIDRSDLSLRSFLTRMHLTRGYPGQINSRWFWAVGVDMMAILLCFWGISGLLMWWQIKATRKLGLITLGFSALVAGSLSFAMYQLFV